MQLKGQSTEGDALTSVLCVYAFIGTYCSTFTTVKTVSDAILFATRGTYMFVCMPDLTYDIQVATYVKFELQNLLNGMNLNTKLNKKLCTNG